MKRTHAIVVVMLLVGLAATLCVHPASAAIRVDGLNGVDDAYHNGSTWALAKKTIQAGIDASTWGEVWVRGMSGGFNGVYNEHITMKTDVWVYGGFAGTETTRPIRPNRPPTDSDPYQTIIDGTPSGYVVQVNSGARNVGIDGFTIRNGKRVFGLPTTGGAILSIGAGVNVSHNIIENNSDVLLATGLYLFPMAFDYNLVRNNSGWGILLEGGMYCTPPGHYVKARNNIITGNTFTGSAAITIAGAGAVSCNIVAGNTGDGIGVGMASRVDIVGNTIAYNTGKGITIDSVLNPMSQGCYIRNNIVAMNGSTGIWYQCPTTPVLYNNDVWANYPDYYGVSPGINDISVDPVFSDPYTGNYHLMYNSPCIGAGQNTSPGTYYDIDGQTRIMPTGGVIDIGADEYMCTNVPPTTPVIYDVGECQTDHTYLYAWWQSTCPDGIVEYQYAVGTSPTDPGSGYVIPWTSTGTDNWTQPSGLNLQTFTTYYFYVKARSSCNVWSSVGVSDGILIGPDPFTIHIEPRDVTINHCTDIQDVTITCTYDNNIPCPAGTEVALYTGGIALFYPSGNSYEVLQTDSDGHIHTQVSHGSSTYFGTDTITAQAAWTCAYGYDSTTITIPEYIPDATLTVDPNEITGPTNCDVTFTATNPDNTPCVGLSVEIGTNAGTFQGKTNPFTALTDSNGEVTAVLVLDPAQNATVSAAYAEECSGTRTLTADVVYHQPQWLNVGVNRSSMLVADLVPGGAPEVAVVDNTATTRVWDSAGYEVFSSPYYYGDNTLSAADLDGRGGLELVAPMGTTNVAAFGYDTTQQTFTTMAGWPTATPFPFVRVSAALGDANLDGTKEIVAGDESCYVFSWNPTGDAANGGNGALWIQVAGSHILSSSVALGDINPDFEPYHMPDAIVGASGGFNPWGFNGDEWHNYATQVLCDGWQTFPVMSLNCSPVIGDMDGDGENDIAVGDPNGNMWIHLSTDTQYWRSYQCVDAGNIESSPAIAQIDGVTCLAFGSTRGRVFLMTPYGVDMPGWEGGIPIGQKELYAQFAVAASPLVGMVIAASGEPQIIAACNDGNVYALWGDGADHAGGPVAKVWTCSQYEGVPIESTPAFCSLDGTHLDLIVGSQDGIYKIHFDGTNGNDNIAYNPNDWSLWQWRTFHYDNARTGCTTPPTTTTVASSIFGRVKSSLGYWLEGTERGSVTVQYWNGSTWVDETRVHVQGRTTPIWETRYMPLLTAGNGTSNDEYDEGAFVASQLILGERYRLVISAPNHATEAFSVNGGGPIPAGRIDVGDLTLTHL